MPYRISKTPYGSYEVLVGSTCYLAVTASSAIGLFAALLLDREHLCRSEFATVEPSSGEWLFTVESVGRNLWMVSVPDGRFISHLAWDECLGVISACLLGIQPMYGGFRTYEQEIMRPWHCETEIRGLLTSQ